MNRKLQEVAKIYNNAIKILSTICCENGVEEALTEEERWLMVEQTSSDCSPTMLENAQNVIEMINSIPLGRLCERTDCNYHHPENYKMHNFEIFQDKCDECIHNEKCKDKEIAMEHFEDFQGVVPGE